LINVTVNFADLSFSRRLAAAVWSERLLITVGMIQYCGGNWRGSGRQSEAVEDLLPFKSTVT